jgi:NAD kinase
MRPFIFFDKKNPDALAAVQGFKHHSFDTESSQLPPPDTILVLGGDGTMIKAIHEHYDKNLPFYGVNYGHMGFLLNDNKNPSFFTKEYELPLLEVLYKEDEEEKDVTVAIAVNDAWVERASPQTASLRLKVGKQTRIEKLYADGLLVSSPQGSTAYARAMGGTPLPLDTKAIQIVGNNVSFPQWKSAILGLKQLITIENHDTKKRPINLYADGILLKQNTSKVVIGIHKEKIKLQFDVNHNLAEKIAILQFPKQ